MGISLNSQTLKAFVDELGSIEKTALPKIPKILGLDAKGGWILGAAKGFPADVAEAARRGANPFYGVLKGWREMSPRGAYKLYPERRAKDWLGNLKNIAEKKAPGVSPHLLEHVESPVPLLQGEGAILRSDLPHRLKMQRAAEELSRRGWTGKGKVTKYLPVGDKGLLTGFTALEVPSIISAEKPTPTGGGWRV